MSCYRSFRFARFCVLYLTLGLGLLSAADAEPTMDVTCGVFSDDFDESRPGFERLFIYNAKNLSDPGDINNMISFTVPAGLNQGVYDAAPATGWLYSILSDSTLFWGNGHVITPGSERTFGVYSTLLHVGSGEATAVAWNLGDHIPFNSVTVPVPAYHPWDRDQDADIDGDDLGEWVSCVSGPAIAYTGDCAWADLDGDQDVDQSDFGRFQRCLTGPGGGYRWHCEQP